MIRKLVPLLNTRKGEGRGGRRKGFRNVKVRRAAASIVRVSIGDRHNVSTEITWGKTVFDFEKMNEFEIPNSIPYQEP